MGKISVVARREYKALVRTKAFIISLIAMPLFSVGAVAIQAILQQNADTKGGKGYGLYRHGDVCSVSVKLDTQENILERIDG